MKFIGFQVFLQNPSEDHTFSPQMSHKSTKTTKIVRCNFDVLALEVSQNAFWASPCCIGSNICLAPHAAWGADFRFFATPLQPERRFAETVLRTNIPIQILDFGDLQRILFPS